MAGKLARESSLRELLDSLHRAHKNDINDFSSGHLNESNLWKPSEKATHQSWNSATKKIPTLVKRSHIPKRPEDLTKQNKMKETMLSFSLGTKDILPLPRQKVSPRKRLHDRKASYIADEVYVEEVRLPEIMLPLTVIDNKQKTSEISDKFAGDDEDSKLAPSQAEILERNLSHKLRHHFIPSHLACVTKKDQYKTFKTFETNVLKKQDAQEQNVLSGYKAVEHHEKHLKYDLDNLSQHGYGPNFHRLQIYSNVFDDLIQDCSSFGYIFRTIKKEYDAYIAHLLDAQPSQHQLLENQIEQLMQRGTSNPIAMNQQRKRLKGLEQEAKQLLDLNDRLRKQIQDEREELANAPEIATPRVQQRKTAPQLNLGEQVEHTKATILEKLDEMRTIQERLRDKYVPATVIQHLEQCVKDTEADNHKLTKKVEFYRENIEQMEKDLIAEIEAADTNSRDKKRLWKAVNGGGSKKLENAAANSPRGSPRADTGGRYEDQQLKMNEEGRENDDIQDDENDTDDEESKWNWYIS
ncbi:uncharacterized protein C6orf118-like [Tubulanus polymorphus]|uniref:uncharacterized protein C6orf118-like n=1 Tax=Tubulanus polymorphus TaxID=672921 RepID=UPI003DA2ADF7